MQSAGTPPAVAAPARRRTPAPARPQDSARLTISWDAVPAQRSAADPATRSTRASTAAAGPRSAPPRPSERSLGHTIPYDGAQLPLRRHRHQRRRTSRGPRRTRSSFTSVGIPRGPGEPSVTTPAVEQRRDVRVAARATPGPRSFTAAPVARRQAGAPAPSPAAAPRARSSVQPRRVWAPARPEPPGRAPTTATPGRRGVDRRSNQLPPYGDTPAPTGLNANRSGNDITWTWNNQTNGRAIDESRCRSTTVAGRPSVVRESFTHQQPRPRHLPASRSGRMANRAATGDSAQGQWSPGRRTRGATMPDRTRRSPCVKGSACTQRSLQHRQRLRAPPSWLAWIKVADRELQRRA